MVHFLRVGMLLGLAVLGMEPALAEEAPPAEKRVATAGKADAAKGVACEKPPERDVDRLDRLADGLDSFAKAIERVAAACLGADGKRMWPLSDACKEADAACQEVNQMVWKNAPRRSRGTRPFVEDIRGDWKGKKFEESLPPDPGGPNLSCYVAGREKAEERRRMAAANAKWVKVLAHRWRQWRGWASRQCPELVRSFTIPCEEKSVDFTLTPKVRGGKLVGITYTVGGISATSRIPNRKQRDAARKKTGDVEGPSRGLLLTELPTGEGDTFPLTETDVSSAVCHLGGSKPDPKISPKIYEALKDFLKESFACEPGYTDDGDYETCVPLDIKEKTTGTGGRG